MSTPDQPKSWDTSSPGPMSFAQSLDFKIYQELKELYIAMPPQEDHIPPTTLNKNIKYLRIAREECFPTNRFFAQIKLKLEFFKEKGRLLPDYRGDDKVLFLLALKRNPDIWATNGLAPLLLHVALYYFIEHCQIQDDQVEILLRELVDVETGCGTMGPLSEFQENNSHYRNWECVAKEGLQFYNGFSRQMQILMILPGTASCHCGLCGWVLKERQGYINLSNPKLLSSLNEILIQQDNFRRLEYIAEFFFERLKLLLRGKMAAHKVLQEVEAAEEKLNGLLPGEYISYQDLFPGA